MERQISYSFIEDHSGLKRNNECAEVEYYIAVPGRTSNMIHKAGAPFKEIISPGAFQESLNRNYRNVSVKMNYNHDKSKVVAERNRLELLEDRIGLKAYALIDDPEIVYKILYGEIVGCSFEFNSLKERREDQGYYSLRYVDKLDLLAVTIVGEGRNPIYNQGVLQKIYVPPIMYRKVLEVKLKRISEQGKRLSL
jgi:HK97 family phage prohead protease